MSKEYSLAIALLLGGILKLFGYEIPNETLETVIFSVGTMLIAFFRHQKGDINVLGAKI